MQWSEEAEKAVSRVPFFVRKRVRKKVEGEAGRRGASRVTMDHVDACRERFLNRMDEEVRGYQVETCFGHGGCPNRAVDCEGFVEEAENRMARADLRSFLKEKTGGPLKLHHEFRVSISDCPNACSRPQIADLGFIGACAPVINQESCTGCGACVAVCREGAISLSDDRAVVNGARCVRCGRCVGACKAGAIKDGEKGYRILLGGKLGRHPRLAEEIPGIHSADQALKILERVVEEYCRRCRKGERLGEILEEVGGFKNFFRS